jgi:TDG/mug DNA glycosylase family protein
VERARAKLDAVAAESSLPDYLREHLELLLVGINPGLRSAEKGHHFAGPGNKFWSLLFESGLVPRLLGYEEDSRLLDHGIGLTNIVARASRSSSELGPADFGEGRKTLVEKVRAHRPRVVGLLGITVFREIWPELSSRPRPKRVDCGLRPERVGESALFVLPNPSGRNAHFTYEEMLRHWRELARFLSRA